jgi:hypothetical protein
MTNSDVALGLARHGSAAPGAATDAFYHHVVPDHAPRTAQSVSLYVLEVQIRSLWRTLADA